MLMVVYIVTARKMSKYGDLSGTYFPVFGPKTGKYGPVKTPYLDSFYEVCRIPRTVIYRNIDFNC